MATSENQIDQIILRGPATVAHGECTECGRDYSDDLAITRCLADDCPSHWECAGVAHPEHVA